MGTCALSLQASNSQSWNSCNHIPVQLMSLFNLPTDQQNTPLQVSSLSSKMQMGDDTSCRKGQATSSGDSATASSCHGVCQSNQYCTVMVNNLTQPHHCTCSWHQQVPNCTGPSSNIFTSLHSTCGTRCSWDSVWDPCSGPRHNSSCWYLTQS